MEREFDVMIWGGTGYTGKLAVAHAVAINARRRTCDQSPIKFCVAGRSAKKVEDVVARATDVLSTKSELLSARSERLSTKPELLSTKPELLSTRSELVSTRSELVSTTSELVSTTSELVSTTSDEAAWDAGVVAWKESVCLKDAASVEKMVGSSKVLVSFVGPFMAHGEAVMRACVTLGTHYVDITAELPWVQEMRGKYHDDAVAKSLKLVCCSGYDFLPSDLMMLQLKTVLDGTNDPSKCVIRQVVHSFSQSTPFVSGGTAISAALMFRRFPTWSKAFSWLLNPYAVAADPPKTFDRNSIAHYLPIATPTHYCAPFLMTHLMNKFVHWSNEVNRYAYGRNLIYSGGTFCKNVVVAYVAAVIYWVGVVAAVLGSSLPLRVLRFLLPDQGSGPAISNKSYLYANLQAYVDVAPGRTQLVTLKWRLLKGEAYRFTAIGATEAAVLIASQPSKATQNGLLPASAAIGIPLLQALAAAGVDMAEPEVTSLS